MTNEGFICISRGIREHWVWNNPVFFKRWVELIMMANYDNREVSFSFHRLMLQRGQLAVNLSYLSKIWHISTQATQKFLVKLEVSGMVTRTVDDKVTVITICNYDRYQLKMGTVIDGSVDGVVNGEVDKVVNQTNKGNKLIKENIKTSAEVLCQVPLELDMPEAVEKDYISWEKFVEFFNTAMRGKTIPKIRGFHLAEHTFYVDNLFAYVPLPYVRTIFYLPVDMYRYYIGRADQSVNEAVMIGRIDQQIAVNKQMIDEVHPDDLSSEGLTRYMAKYLGMICMVTSSLLIKEGSSESIVKRDELWEYFKEENPEMYEIVNKDILSKTMQFKSAIGKKIVRTGYAIARKVYGFN